jgi:hypothetical protein
MRVKKRRVRIRPILAVTQGRLIKRKLIYEPCGGDRVETEPHPSRVIHTQCSEGGALKDRHLPDIGALPREPKKAPA